MGHCGRPRLFCWYTRSPEIHCFVRTLCVAPMQRNWPQHVDGLKANCPIDCGMLDKSRLVMWEGRSRNPLFTLPGVTALILASDYMHSQYLGMDPYMFGSTLWVLCFIVMTGTPEENLDWCWAFTKRFYKEHRATTRYRYLNRLHPVSIKILHHKIFARVWDAQEPIFYR